MKFVTEREVLFIAIACLPPMRRNVLRMVCDAADGIRTAKIAKITGRDISNVGLDLETIRAAKLIVRDASKVYRPASLAIKRLSRSSPCVGVSNGHLNESIGLSILALAREMVHDDIYPGCRTISVLLGITKDVAYTWSCRFRTMRLWPSTKGLHWTDCRARQKTEEAVKAKMPNKPYKRPLGSPRKGKVLESDRGRVTPHTGRFK
jgi:hypothetical protein